MNNSLRILGCYSGSGGYRRYPSSQLLILNNKNYLPKINTASSLFSNN